MVIALIAGLGNPGKRYADTYHSAGIRFVEELARRESADLIESRRFSARVARLALDGGEVWVIAPTLYMNESGRSVATFAHFYRLPTDALLVAHDDIDLPLGAARFKRGGGHGGHNGLRSVSSCLGGNGYYRLRLGVGRPRAGNDVNGYLLTRAPRDGLECVERSFERVLGPALGLLLKGDFAKATTLLHSAPVHAGQPPPPSTGGQ